MPGGSLLALTDDLLNLLAHLVEADVKRLESLRGNTLALVNQAEQNVLGADVVVVQQLRFFLSEHHNTTGLVGEFFKHL